RKSSSPPTATSLRNSPNGDMAPAVSVAPHPPVSHNRKTTAPSRACGLALKGVDVRQRTDARTRVRQSDRHPIPPRVGARLHRISTSSPAAAQQGGDSSRPERKIHNEINGDRLGTVFAALQHTGNGGRSRGASACALLKKEAESDPMSGDFNPEQKRYLEGFVAGLQIAKAARASAGPPTSSEAKTAEPGGPDAAHLRAQDRVLAAGGKLSEQ